MFNLRSRRKSESDSEKFSSTVQFKGPEGCIRSETGFGFCKVGQSHVDKITFVGWSTMFRWFGVAVETGFNEKIICDRFLGLYSKPAMRNRGRMKTFILYFSQQVGKHLNWPFRASLSFPFRFRFLLGALFGAPVGSEIGLEERWSFWEPQTSFLHIFCHPLTSKGRGLLKNFDVGEFEVSVVAPEKGDHCQIWLYIFMHFKFFSSQTQVLILNFFGALKYLPIPECTLPTCKRDSRSWPETSHNLLFFDLRSSGNCCCIKCNNSPKPSKVAKIWAVRKRLARIS